MTVVVPPPAVDLAVPDPRPTPTLERARARLSARPESTRRSHAVTVAAVRLSRAERAAGEVTDYPDDVERPRTRGDCLAMSRPCPFVSCAHHLYLDVDEKTGAIKFNFPHLDVDEMVQTCSLDVADRGGAMLDEVGKLIGVTRERIRQIEVHGLEQIRRFGAEELGLPPEVGDGFASHVGRRG